MKIARQLYLFLILATLVIYGTMIFWAGPRIASESNGGIPFDLHVFGYSKAKADAFLAALSEDGRAFYLGPAMWLDTFFPAMLALVLGWALWRLLARQALILRIGAACLVAGYALFDYLENAAVARILLAQTADLPTGLVATASRWTILKFFFVEAAVTVLVVLLVARAIRYFRHTAEIEDRVFTVAIDGPAAAGKGTIGRAVAREFGFSYLDTGLLYRAVGMLALDAGGLDETRATNAVRALSPADMSRPDLRSPVAADAASKVAAMAGVRAALLDFQKKLARRPGGAVLDGRDIGTVVCPLAEVKLYVTASPETRARRRFDELSGEGGETTFDDVLKDVRARDDRDASRSTAPMKPAPDAHLLDTTELSIDAAVAEAVALIRKRIEQGRA